MSLDSNLQSAFTAVGTAIKGKISSSEKGVANGVATLDGTGKIPSAQLPSYVDDVVEYANLVSFPATGSAGILYIALDTNKQYRWGGTVYVAIDSGAVTSVAGKTGVVTLGTSDVGGLDTALSGKAASSHTHAIADVAGLQIALDGKASASTVSTLVSGVGATDTDYVAVFNAALV